MIKLRKGISFKFLLIFIVAVLGVVPLVLMQTVVNHTVRKNILNNTTILTQGILNQSHNYINLLIRELDSQISQIVSDENTISVLSKEDLTEKNILDLVKDKNRFNIISSFILINVDQTKQSLILSPGTERYRDLSSREKEEFLKSQQAAILKENNAIILRLGSSPKGVKNAIASLWSYRFFAAGEQSYIIACSLSRDDVITFLSEVSSSSRSEVLLLSSDNIAFPEDKNFFEYPFAAAALSRSAGSRFNIIYDERETPNGFEQLMIQVYTDPEYFYNLIIMTPQMSLLRGYNSIEQTANITLLILAIVSVSLGLTLIFSMDSRLKTYFRAVNNITEGQYDIVILPARVPIEEDLTITAAIIKMAEEIQKNRNNLKYANENLENIINQRTTELKKSLNELHMTRQSLIHSEKMATLGRQGAKIAHEMNNPLSVAITASSHMGSTVKEINRKFEESKLTKSDFIYLSKTAIEVSEIIQRNLKQAAEMTKRFKDFASNQSREERKTIRIGNYINEIINSYKYKLKNTSYEIKLNCDENLEVKTDPSIIYQTITNLINNSILHGFENKDAGNITINVSKIDQSIIILYMDDGKGIPENVISQLYKPFFTTKADEGGTGLGLNIIKDLIEKELNGTIECKSKPGEGVQFTISFPS